MDLGRLATGMLIAVSLAMPAGAAPLFSDISSEHWASDAVRSLADKGLIQGVNGDTFQGERALTRWELASIVARLLSQVEAGQSNMATKAELEEINRLASRLQPELQALGVRLNSLEKQTSLLDARISELERLTYYGSFHTIGVANSIKGETVENGNSAVDLSTGRLMSDGQGLSMVAILGVNVEINDDINAGAEFAAYASVGKSDINSYWGVEAPYNANIWTSRNSYAPWEQSANNQPFTRMVLDSIWVNHEPSNTRFIAGSFNSRYMASSVFNGAYNPNIRGNSWLPFYGLDISGDIGDTGLRYEAMYTVDPNKSLYHSHSLGGTLRYNFNDDRGQVAVHLVNHRDERIDGGTLEAPGLTQIPAIFYYGAYPGFDTNTWLGQSAGDVALTPKKGVGPQQQLTYGIEASYEILEEYGLVLGLAYNSSVYDPDTSKLLYNTTARGSMYKANLSVAPVEGLALDLQFQSVDPTYDPFIVQYSVDPLIPVYLPYGSFYSGYYQMHDYVDLPNNRQGFKFAGSYSFNEDNTRIKFHYSNLWQLKATTPEQCQKVGNIEPVFGLLYGGSDEKGSVQGYGLGISHIFDNEFKLEANYFHYDIVRSAALAENDMNLRENMYRLDIAYPITSYLNLRASYVDINYKGHSGLIETDMIQRTPSIGFEYQMAHNVNMALDYRYIDFDQRAYDGADYTANQIMLEMKTNF